MKDNFASAGKIKNTEHIALDQTDDQFSTAHSMTARTSQSKVQKDFHKPA